MPEPEGILSRIIRMGNQYHDEYRELPNVVIMGRTVYFQHMSETSRVESQIIRTLISYNGDPVNLLVMPSHGVPPNFLGVGKIVFSLQENLRTDFDGDGGSVGAESWNRIYVGDPGGDEPGTPERKIEIPESTGSTRLDFIEDDDKDGVFEKRIDCVEY